MEGAAPSTGVGDERSDALSDLPHLDDEGAARMVDVGAKEVTERFARAEAVRADVARDGGGGRDGATRGRAT